MRLCVLLVFACGPGAVATRPAPAPQPAPQPAPRIDTAGVIDRLEPWARHEPHVQNVQAPLGPQLDFSEPEPERVVQPAPKPKRPGRRAPCFAHRDVLVGSEVYSDLWQHAPGMSSEHPPSGTYGTCTIKDGQLRDAKGTLLAELHCGITIYVPGIIDPYGFEVGAHGKDVALEQKPDGEVLCWGDDDKHARCWMDAEDHEEGAHYMFAATLPIARDHLGPLRGAKARKLFESHVVSHFTVRMTCH